MLHQLQSAAEALVHKRRLFEQLTPEQKTDELMRVAAGRGR